ncbi:helix-turn-helix domain-containing protein [Pseudonocardia sp. NPDC049635]|uniref:IclR family transcriptional regulator n=1 Tax=Pseudonocardia sp. NPDC049635 TaxID=3155506 RepID=UPI0033C8A430
MDIQVVQRVAEILEAFSDDVHELRLGPLAQDLGVQRSTLHRYLNSMANAGLLDRTANGGFGLGPLLTRLAPIALDVSMDFSGLGQVMESLAVETGLTAVRSVWNDVSPVVVQVHNPPNPTHINVRAGTRLPVTSAQTLAFLAYGDPATAERVTALLPHSDRIDVEEALIQTKRLGIAIGGRVDEGVRALAAPVLDRAGTVAMTLALVGTEAAVNPSPTSRTAHALLRAASSISTRLGYAPPRSRGASA